MAKDGSAVLTAVVAFLQFLYILELNMLQEFLVADTSQLDRFNDIVAQPLVEFVFYTG